MNVKFLGFLILASFLVCATNGIDANSTDIEIPPKQTYKEAEKEVTKFINDQLRSILPRVVGGAGSSTLSQRCMAGMMKVFSSIRGLKGWSIKCKEKKYFLMILIC